MKFRKLGRTGLEVSEIGFGGSGIGGQTSGPLEDRQSMAALQRAFELGINYFDTALVYGYGHSERLLAEFIRREKIRDRVIIATKIPPMNLHWPASAHASVEEVYPPHHIKTLTRESLRNLRVQYIDVFMLHVFHDHFLDEDGWQRTIQDLKSEGVIRHFGISVGRFEPKSALRAVRSGIVDVLQVHYNVFEQSPADELFGAAREHGVGIVCRSPLEESALAGRLAKDTRFAEGDPRSVYFAAEKLAEVVDRVEGVRASLEAAAGSMASGALRFCLSHPQVSTVIPGIRTVEQAELNAAASDDGPLPPEVIERLRAHRWDRGGSW